VAGCDICGKEEFLPYRCSYCGGTFCSDHRLPEKHQCEGIYDIPVKVRRDDEIRISGRRERKRRDVSIYELDPNLSRKKNIFQVYGYNNVILAIITVMFAVELIFKPVIGYLWLDPKMVFQRPWQLVTSIFLHGSFDHYLVNAIVLFFFGSELERRVGGSSYLKIFLLSGIFGNLMYLAFSEVTSSSVPALGASGAIYGVMGTLAVIAPEIRVLLFFVVPMNIRLVVVLFALYNLFLTPFSIFTGVAYVAHLGGLIVGLYYGKVFSQRRRFH